jgi:Primase X
LQQTKKHNEQNRDIKVIQRWDGFRPKANPLYYHFYIYLADRKVQDFNMQRKQTQGHHTFRCNTIPWIEKLLKTPIEDYRKNTVSLILAPYIINVKKLSYDVALNIINNWLSKCNLLAYTSDENRYMSVRTGHNIQVFLKPFYNEGTKMEQFARLQI